MAASAEVEVLETAFVSGELAPHAWANDVALFVQNALAGYVEVDVAGSSNVTLTQAQYDCPLIVLTGTLTGSINLVMPAKRRRWLIFNNSAGAFTITAKTSGGSGVVVTQGRRALVYGDGTDVLAGLTGFPSGLSIGSDGTLVKKVTAGTVSLNPTSIAAGATGDTTFPLTGAAAGDRIIMDLPASLEAGLIYGGAFVSAADTVTVRLGNLTGSPIDGAAKTWSYTWLDLT